MRSVGRGARGLGICRSCGAECAPSFYHSLYADGGDDAGRTLAEMGLPAWDVAWARYQETIVGIEIAGDERAEIAHATEGG